jgi:hypothetical protein
MIRLKRNDAAKDEEPEEVKMIEPVARISQDQPRISQGSAMDDVIDVHDDSGDD